MSGVEKLLVREKKRQQETLDLIPSREALDAFSKRSTMEVVWQMTDKPKR